MCKDLFIVKEKYFRIQSTLWMLPESLQVKPGPLPVLLILYWSTAAIIHLGICL